MSLGDQLNTQIGATYQTLRKEMVERGELDEAVEELIALIVSQEGEHIILETSQVAGNTDLIRLQGKTLTGDYRCVLAAPNLIQVVYRKEFLKGHSGRIGFDTLRRTS